MLVMVLVVDSYCLDALIVCRNATLFVFHIEFSTVLLFYIGRLVDYECACLARYMRIA